MSIEPNCLPRTAERVDNHLVFYDSGFAIGRCDLHDDQEIYGSDSPIQHVPGTVEVWPDDWEGENAFFRLKPETFRAYETGVIPDRGPEQIYFDRDQSREWLFDELPALRDAAERRSYLAAMARWEKECDRIYDTNPDISTDELPPQPVFEPARAEWDAWRTALAQWEALMNELDSELGERRREGRPALDDNQKARVDALCGQIQKLGNAYMDKLPMDKIEPKSQDAIDRQKLYGPPANSLTSGTAYAIACMAARPIDDFNDNWSNTERWPDAPLLPVRRKTTRPSGANSIRPFGASWQWRKRRARSAPTVARTFSESSNWCTRKPIMLSSKSSPRTAAHCPSLSWQARRIDLTSKSCGRSKASAAISRTAKASPTRPALTISERS
jgi:hypothetical protein